MLHITALNDLLLHDPLRLEALKAIRSLALPDCWIAAGFVRDAVWDHLHGYSQSRPSGDVDVVWYDAGRLSAEYDREIQLQLCECIPTLDWSVKNQARMHLRNNDAAYHSVADAMRYWPETATAVAIRLGCDDFLEVNAPFGLDDLFALRLRPTESFVIDKRTIFQQRLTEKRWLERYPLLRAMQA